MAKNSDRVKLCFNEDWFNVLMQALYTQQDFLDSLVSKGRSEYFDDLEGNKKLVNKIVRYSRFEQSSDGNFEVRVDLFPSEAREMIWQLLFECLYWRKNDLNDTDLSFFKKVKQLHEDIKSGNLTLPELLNREAAEYLYAEMMFGATYLVKNKDGVCYLVDHGCTGKPIKKVDQWEDPEYGFDENVFQESEIAFNIVSWKDEKPLDIYDYLLTNGWIKHDEKGRPTFIE